jgi:hypothetical protein
MQPLREKDTFKNGEYRESVDMHFHECWSAGGVLDGGSGDGH